MLKMLTMFTCKSVNVYALIIVVPLIIFFIVKSAEAALNDNDIKVFNEVIEYVQREHITGVKNERIIEAALQGVMSSLDPHSTYLTSKEYNDMKIATKGEFGGVGLELILDNSMVKVLSPYSSGPAFKAGVREGDYIIAINGKFIHNPSLAEVGEKLRGVPGSKVELQVYRTGVGRVDFSIVREVIKLNAVKVEVIGNNEKIAYIKIAIFNDRTAALVEQELDITMKKTQNLVGVVLDLRWNPGGVLTQAKEVTDLFLDYGDIVYIKGKDAAQSQLLKAEPGDISNGMPIAVLINGGSASAAEIVAGALQDNGRAVIVGMKSFGKGSIQKIVPLADNIIKKKYPYLQGAALKITTALYYTPSGTCIQEHGIIPNIVVPDVMVQQVENEKALEINEHSLSKHLKSSTTDSKSLATKKYLVNTLGETQDFQLLRALDIVKTIAFMRKNKICVLPNAS